MAKNYYTEAPEVELMAKQIIELHHVHLLDQKIEYVFRSEPKKDGDKVALGTARKISGLNAFLANSVDEEFQLTATEEQESFFVVEIWHKAWKEFDDAKRRALVDHELCHCSVDEEVDNNGNSITVLSIRPHDVEEFTEILDRHGLWKRDLSDFADIAAKKVVIRNASMVAAIDNVTRLKPPCPSITEWAKELAGKVGPGVQLIGLDAPSFSALASSVAQSSQENIDILAAGSLELNNATFEVDEYGFHWPGPFAAAGSAE